MREVIATIMLCPGQSGYYDDYSNIYLTQSNPVKKIYAGTNCTQLSRSVKAGRLKILSGSLVQSNTNTATVKKMLEDKKRQDVINKLEVFAAPLKPPIVDPNTPLEVVEIKKVDDMAAECIKDELKVMKITPSKIGKLAVNGSREFVSEVENVVYTSEDESVASIEGNKITGITAGKTTIIATAEGYEDKKILVTVV